MGFTSPRQKKKAAERRAKMLENKEGASNQPLQKSTDSGKGKAKSRGKGRNSGKTQTGNPKKVDQLCEEIQDPSVLTGINHMEEDSDALVREVEDMMESEAQQGSTEQDDQPSTQPDTQPQEERQQAGPEQGPVTGDRAAVGGGAGDAAPQAQPEAEQQKAPEQGADPGTMAVALPSGSSLMSRLSFNASGFSNLAMEFVQETRSQIMQLHSTMVQLSRSLTETKAQHRLLLENLPQQGPVSPNTGASPYKRTTDEDEDRARSGKKQKTGSEKSSSSMSFGPKEMKGFVKMIREVKFMNQSKGSVRIPTKEELSAFLTQNLTKDNAYANSVLQMQNANNAKSAKQALINCKKSLHEFASKAKKEKRAISLTEANFRITTMRCYVVNNIYTLMCSEDLLHWEHRNDILQIYRPIFVRENWVSIDQSCGTLRQMISSWSMYSAKTGYVLNEDKAGKKAKGSGATKKDDAGEEDSGEDEEDAGEDEEDFGEDEDVEEDGDDVASRCSSNSAESD